MKIGIINDKAEYEVVELSLSKQSFSQVFYEELHTKFNEDASYFMLYFNVDSHKEELGYIHLSICSDFGFVQPIEKYIVWLQVDIEDNIELYLSGYRDMHSYQNYEFEKVDCWLSDEEKLLIKGMCLRALVED